MEEGTRTDGAFVETSMSEVALNAALPSRLSLDWATVSVLARRDVVRFFRQRTRIIGALAQPILFWFVIGGGFAGSFRIAGAEGMGYMPFFFPGVVTMVLLFSAIFATITVIEDRREGFLQCVIAGPGSRLSLVLGKCAGSSLIALIQAGLFLCFAPLAEVKLSTVNLPLLAAALVLTSLALTGLGFALAWWINSATGYHAVMSVVLIPMWILSGAMFPVRGAGPVLSALMWLNPMRFAVEAIRTGLYGVGATEVVTGQALLNPWLNVGALSVFAGVVLSLSAWRVNRRT
ncbi:MAG: ABC transporter permease [Myxococcaceae bacterium]